jgi:uncharacterized protein YaaW (UPF0174 family)
MQSDVTNVVLKSPQKNVILGLLIACVAFGVAYLLWSNLGTGGGGKVKPDPLLPYLGLDKKWKPSEFNDFTSNLNQDRRNSLKKALKIDANIYRSQEEEITAIRKQFLWACSHWGPYIFRNENQVQYHEVVQWTATKLKVDKKLIATMNTFQLEHKILESIFASMWDKLTPEQRLKILKDMDKNNTLDRVGIASMSGAGAIAALSTTVYLSGFAFYTTMSSVIAAIGGFFGVTLPFSAYLTSSVTVALLSGPVGWGIAAVAAAGGCWLIGGADIQTTSAFIIQIHYTKMEALSLSKEPFPVF